MRDGGGGSADALLTNIHISPKGSGESNKYITVSKSLQGKALIRRSQGKDLQRHGRDDGTLDVMQGHGCDSRLTLARGQISIFDIHYSTLGALRRRTSKELRVLDIDNILTTQ